VKLSAEVHRDEIEGAGANEPFIERDGEIVHLANVASLPDQSSIEDRDLVYFVGRFPDSVARAAQRDEPCVRVFVEVDTDRFVHLGLGRIIAVRLGEPELIGFQTEAPLSDAWLERIAPHVLEAPAVRSASVDVFVELARSSDGWRATVPSVGVDVPRPTYRDALSSASEEAIARIFRALADGDESVQSVKPEVEGLRAMGEPAHEWPMNEIEAARRVVVRVNAFSADLDSPGWALSHDEVWFG
jgi:hypothetical protein